MMKARTFPKHLLRDLAAVGEAREHGRAPIDLMRRVVVSLNALPPRDVVRADEIVPREAHMFSWWYWPPPKGIFARLWRWVNWWQPPHLKDSGLVRRHPELAPLFLFHKNGYVRQAALRSLQSLPSGFVAAALALRLNDWVEQVREAALHALERQPVAERAEVVAQAASFLVDRRLYWARWNPRAIAALDALYDNPEVVTALVRRMTQSPTEPMARVLRHVLRSGAYDTHLEALMQCAVQPSVRAVALQTLLRGEARIPAGYGWEWQDKVFGIRRRIPLFDRRPLGVAVDRRVLIERGLADRSPQVRLVAADAVTESPGEVADLSTVVRRLVADAGTSVRMRGEFLARKLAEGAG